MKPFKLVKQVGDSLHNFVETLLCVRLGMIVLHLSYVNLAALAVNRCV